LLIINSYDAATVQRDMDYVTATLCTYYYY